MCPFSPQEGYLKVFVPNRMRAFSGAVAVLVAVAFVAGCASKAPPRVSKAPVAFIGTDTIREYHLRYGKSPPMPRLVNVEPVSASMSEDAAREKLFHRKLWDRVASRYEHSHGLTSTSEERLAAASAMFGANNPLTSRGSGISSNMATYMTNGLIRRWKFHKALYDRYGGKLVLSQIGTLAVDAYLAHLRDLEDRGVLRFVDLELRGKLFEYYESLSAETDLDPHKADQYFAKPPWAKTNK